MKMNVRAVVQDGDHIFINFDGSFSLSHFYDIRIVVRASSSFMRGRFLQLQVASAEDEICCCALCHVQERDQVTFFCQFF